jgi:hypothetical protein
VQEQVGTYSRRGFVEAGRVRLLQRASLDRTPLTAAHDHLLHPRADDAEELFALDKIPASKLAQSDCAHTGLLREKLWSREALLGRRDVIGFALVSEADSAHEKLTGWILVRECDDGFRFGPLYADSPDRAELLLVAAMKRLEGREGSFAIEAWPANVEAEKVFKGLGWTEVGIDYHRMWLNGKVPQEQMPGGKAEKAVYAMFDAGEG